MGESRSTFRPLCPSCSTRTKAAPSLDVFLADVHAHFFVPHKRHLSWMRMCCCVRGTRAHWFLGVWEWENISIAHLGCSCTVKLPVVSLAESKRQFSSSFLLPPPPPLALLLSLDLLCSWHLSHTHFSLSLTLSPPFLCISSGREYGVSHYLMEIRREGKEPDLPVICLDLLGAEWNLLYWSRVLHICTCANSYPTIGASWLH